MKIGIKYCGGCNPRYDRSQEVEKLKKKFPQHTFTYEIENTVCDICLLVCGCMTACAEETGIAARKFKKLLANNWYRQWSESVSFTLYDDGTVTIPGSYGQGKWALVNDDVLKISDFYGETMTLKIDDLDDQWLVVYEMENGQQSEEKITFWNTAEGAQTLRAKF